MTHDNHQGLEFLIRAACAGMTTWTHVGQMALAANIAAEDVEVLLVQLCIPEMQRALVMRHMPSPLSLTQIARDAKRLGISHAEFSAMCEENGIADLDAMKEVWHGE